MIDEEEEKKKRGRTRSTKTPSSSGSGSSSGAGSQLLPPNTAAAAVGSLTPQTVKAQPQVRVVGFHVGGTTAPATASPAVRRASFFPTRPPICVCINPRCQLQATPPVAIPSLVEGSSGSGRRIKKSVDGSPSPTSSLGHSLEGLKEYKCVAAAALLFSLPPQWGRQAPCSSAASGAHQPHQLHP
jgi:hypothetical protein